MRNYAENFKPLPTGAGMKEVVSREWVEAVQDALLAILNGEHLELGPGLRKGRGQGRLRLDVDARALSRRGGRVLPFDCVLSEKNGSYEVTVEDGLVIERIPGGTEDPFRPHEVENIREGKGAFPPAAAGDRKAFPIKVGQQVTVLVRQAIDGTVEDEVEVVIEKKNAESIHWLPAGGDDLKGKAGEWHYKLAELVAGEDGSAPELVPWMAGSHIDHWHDITILSNGIEEAEDNVGRVVRGYDAAKLKWLLRSIKSTRADIGITETDTTIEIGTPDGYPDPADGSIVFVDCDNYELAKLQWKGGMITTPGDFTVQVGSCDCCSCSTPGGGSSP